MTLSGSGGLESVQMPIEGMSCASCANGLEGALLDTAGVLRAEVSYEGATAIVVYAPGAISADGLRDVVRRAGFSAAGECEYQTIANRGGRPWVQAFIDHVDPVRCTGCGRCVEACGQDVYALVGSGGERKATVVCGDNCLGDCHCHKACRFGALVCKPQRLAKPPPANGAGGRTRCCEVQVPDTSTQGETGHAMNSLNVGDLAARLNDLSPIEKDVRLAAFGSILDGRSASLRSIAIATGLALELVDRTVESLTAQGMLVSSDSDGVVGSWGLSLTPTPHRLRRKGREFYPWCAEDAVGIPAALGEDAEIESFCHHCGEAMRIELRGGRLSRSSHDEARVWVAAADLGRSIVGCT